tara:strand:- start:179 stop:628 length:450 start_codon:yes stop_codon:yes gene_type:complete
MTVDEKIGLKLIGKNREDLKVISAYLQDSIATVRNMVFLKKNKIFVMIVNRFMWEDVEKGAFRKNKRIKCAIKFEEVTDVKSQNINQKNKNKILECLAIKCSSPFDEIYNIKIYFSGGGTITMISDVIDIVLDDLGKPWNVKHVPIHKI